MGWNKDSQEEIGSKTGFVQVPYTFGDNSILDHLNTNYYHIHGKSFVYPTTANSITITSGAGAWAGLGAIVEVIPENTLSLSAFDLHYINISNMSDDAEYYIEIYSGNAGSEVLIGATRASRNSLSPVSKSSLGTKRIQIPQQLPNKRISCKLYSSIADVTTLDVSFEGHYYAS